jgi:hypothetical protein
MCRQHIQKLGLKFAQNKILTPNSNMWKEFVKGTLF